MKALFLIFHGFEEHNGISKKILYQIKALKNCQADIRLCYYDVDENNHRKWFIDNKTLIDLGSGFFAKLKRRICYHHIVNYAIKENISFVYIRSDHNANPFTINLISRLHQIGIKTVMEIPTFPYDQEYINLRQKCSLFVDKLFRRQLAKSLDAIVTFSNAKIIFGKETINISNGIDFEEIKLKQKIDTATDHLNLIGVAEIHYWHGFDRIIKGLGNYYKQNPEIKVYFNIIGELSGEREKNEILTPIKDYNLEEYVILHGAKYGKELDLLFESAHLGIGSLGRHRCGISNIKTLKNREYAARGISFVYSETDDDFDNMPYVLKVSADETPIDIISLIDFFHSNKKSPKEIRESILHLSWDNQMSKVIDSIFTKKKN